MTVPWQLLWPACTFVAATAIALAFRRVALSGFRRCAPAASSWNPLLEAVRAPSLLWCAVLGFYVTNEVAREAALLPARWHERLGLLLEVAVILSVTTTLAGLSGKAVARVSEGQALAGAVTGLAQTTTRVAVLIVGGLVLLSAMGVQITPILTALGVGGVAVALALQDTLANLFAGVHILADRPVRVGDYVKVADNAEGVVVDIGWRATRIRSLSNTIIVVPNQTVSRATITNYSLPDTRLALGLKVSVEYSADPDHVQTVLLEEAERAVGQIPGLLRDPAPAVSLIPGFGEYSLDFTVGYHVGAFVDQYGVQHELRKRLLRRLRTEGVAIAVPTRTVQLSTDGAFLRSSKDASDAPGPPRRGRQERRP
jgi:small-conductance mechanosensitive channel